jgi:LacI family transcriptional regulator
MAVMLPSIPKVAISISTTLKGERTTLRGIFDYAARHGPWFCVFMEGRPREQLLELAKDRDISGVIVTGLTRLGTRDVVAFGAPIVFVEPSHDMLAPDFPLRGVPYVTRDSHAIGVMAANYYLQRGYKSFAYVGEPDGFHWSAERRRGFEETLAKAGFGCAVHDTFTARERGNWPAERPRLIAFLNGLPRPTAVFAPMDGRARLVLEACLTAGLRVPVEIAVLGVDNDQLLCSSTVPMLSSIRTGGYRRGLLAAEMLDNLMHGRPVRKSAVAQEPLSVVTRGSTGYDAMSDPVIARAITFIRARAPSGGIDVADIVRAANCSRRYLERHFRDRLGRSVRDELVRERIEHVKELLREGDMTVGEITEATGFARDSHLAFLFRKETGRTMLQWRRENRELPDE